MKRIFSFLVLMVLGGVPAYVQRGQDNEEIAVRFR